MADEIEFMTLDEGLKALEAEQTAVDKQKAEETNSDKTKTNTGSNNFEIPDKFKDKSREEIAASYAELERYNGSQANELGALRNRLADLERSVQTSSKAPEEDKPIEFEDFVEDPNSTVDKLVSKAIKKVTDRLDENDRAVIKGRFDSAFPNSSKDLVDPHFQEWIVASPYRQKLLVEASNYNYDSAFELWSSWGERQELLGKAIQAEQTQEQAALDKSLKQAVTESGSTGQSTEKYISREQIIDLQVNDPEKYDALQPQIMELYKKGLIR